MSSKSDISYVGPFRLYKECNDWEKNSDQNLICLHIRDGSKRSEYNGDLCITRDDLRKLVKDIEVFFKDEGMEMIEETSGRDKQGMKDAIEGAERLAAALKKIVDEVNPNFRVNHSISVIAKSALELFEKRRGSE